MQPRLAGLFPLGIRQFERYRTPEHHPLSCTPFVGREQERQLLLARFEQAREGDVQAVLVSGEPGIRKSRLLQQLREDLAGTPHTWTECAASPFFASTPFHTATDLLRSGFFLRCGLLIGARRTFQLGHYRDLLGVRLGRLRHFPSATRFRWKDRIPRRSLLRFRVERLSPYDQCGLGLHDGVAEDVDLVQRELAGLPSLLEALQDDDAAQIGTQKFQPGFWLCWDRNRSTRSITRCCVSGRRTS